ncbi:hypothetical protein [Paraherbaspirillum soli]|uniref:Lipoprotein n=1 Tax=Paraherbaspirillum soli TaxID=631222 RepID=A0ABW0M7T2_9BURK
MIRQKILASAVILFIGLLAACQRKDAPMPEVAKPAAPAAQVPPTANTPASTDEKK